MNAFKVAAPLLLLSAAVPSAAQPGPGERVFTGPHAGVQAGVLEHHFAVQLVVDGASTPTDPYFRSYGLGGGAFAGYDFAVRPRLRFGVEAGAVVGGEGNVARFPTAELPLPPGELRASPRHGYRLTARGGVTFGQSLMLYGSAGYGGHRYRVANRTTVANADRLRSGDSFIVGAGAEYQASRRVGVRLDYKHLDDQTNEWFIGVPVRF